MWVVKLGGSLFGDLPRLREWLDLLATRGAGHVAIVPGGGRFADAVRAEQRRLGFGDLAAHNMAVLAMCQSALVLHAMQPALRFVDDAGSIGDVLRAGGTALWQPLDALRDAPDALTSWDVTSDSLAARLAARLGARGLVIVKWDAPPAGAGMEELTGGGYVDRAFSGFVRRFGGEVSFVPRDGASRLADRLPLPRAGEGGMR